MQYTHFPKFILRTPLLPLAFYFDLTRNVTITNEQLRDACSSDIIKEAIFLASPEFYTELEKWLSGDITNRIKEQRIEHSILKYLSRMSSRCTPFGLFAGTAVGTITDSYNVELKDKRNYKRHTRLDMNFLVVLSHSFTKDPIIKPQLLFYPNSSIYRVGDQFRYVEYTYEKGKRIHHIVGVKQDDFLEKIIKKGENGSKISDLANELISEEITKKDALDFIEQLIEGQFLISELEPSVSGPEFLDQITNRLVNLKNTEKHIEVLNTIQTKVRTLDTRLGNPIKSYLGIKKSIEELNIKFEDKHLFQTDLKLALNHNSLDLKTIGTIKKALSFINRIAQNPKENLLKDFIHRFYERYETREIPLSIALDVEVGLGFYKTKDQSISPIIDDLVLPTQNNNTINDRLRLNPTEKILHSKLLESLKEGNQIIELKDYDFNAINQNWDDLPMTISSMIEIVNSNGKRKFLVKGASGSSAVNLLGRFCHGDQEIHNYVNEIIAFEEANTDAILAEIIHLPESRTGNILMRPALRNYEIPYLAKSLKTGEYQIPITDLYLQCKDGKTLTLKSKKLNRTIIPRLSNAHNYNNYNSLPIYQFLTNMQFNDKRRGFYFDWGSSKLGFEFLPRVEYKDVILSLKTWIINRETIKTLIDTKDRKSFNTEWTNFLSKLRLPQFITLVDGDNELLVNTLNNTSVAMLIDTIKKRSSFTLQEFLYNSPAKATNGIEAYANQIVLAFKKVSKN